MMEKISRGDIQRLRSEGSHDNAAQIANLCLADFSAMDIAFSDLVGEVDAAEKAEDDERDTAEDLRQDRLDEIKALNIAEGTDEDPKS